MGEQPGDLPVVSGSTNPDAKSRMAFEHHFPLAVGTLMPQVMAHEVEHADGSTTSILYLVREGHDFPPPGGSAR